MCVHNKKKQIEKTCLLWGSFISESEEFKLDCNLDCWLVLSLTAGFLGSHLNLSP